MVLKTPAQLKAYFNTGDRPTEAQLSDFIDATRKYDGQAIWTTEGKLYDLTGLSDTDRGTALKTAISEATNNDDVQIWVPPGGYYSADGFTWTKRSTHLLGSSRSRITNLYSDSDHAIKIVLDGLVYNSLITNISCATTGGEFDAVHVSGTANPLSQFDLDVHIHASTRDGLHLETGTNVDNFLVRLKLTSSIDLDRYAVYSDAIGTGAQIEMQATDGHIYLDTNSTNHAIRWNGVSYVQDTKRMITTDLGTNNVIFSPSFVNAFRSIGRVAMDSPNLSVPRSNIIAAWPLDRLPVADGVTYLADVGRNQLCPAKVTGTTSLVNTVFGDVVNFGGDAYFLMDDNAALDSSQILVGALVYLTADVNQTFLRRGNLRLHYDTSDKKIKFHINLNGSTKIFSEGPFNLNEWIVVLGSYDGTTCRIQGNNEINSTTTHAGQTLAHTGDLYVGAFSPASGFVNGYMGGLIISKDASPESIRAVKSWLMTNKESAESNVNAFGGKVYGDLEFETDGVGPILVDTVTATRYRLTVASGTLGVTAV